MNQLKNEEFEAAIISNENVIIEFFAEWCSPCSAMLPTLEEIINQNDNISVFKVDIESEIDLTERFGVRNIPTTLYFKNGVQINKTVGLVNKATMLSKFE